MTILLLINGIFSIITKFGILGTIFSFGVISWKVYSGATEIYIFGLENPYLSLLLVFLLFALVISFFLMLKIILRKIIKFFLSTDNKDEIKRKKNQIYTTTINTTGNLFQMLTVIVALLTSILLLVKDANKSGYIENFQYFKYIKVFTLEEKKQWLDTLKKNVFNQMDDNLWNILIKDIPWNDIKNEQTLVEYFRVALINLEQSLKATQELNEHQRSIVKNVISAVYEGLKSIADFSINHPIMTIVFIGTCYVGYLYFTSSIAEGFKKTGEVASNLNQLTENVSLLNKKIEVISESLISLDRSGRNLENTFNITTEHTHNIFSQLNDIVNAIGNETMNIANQLAEISLQNDKNLDTTKIVLTNLQDQIENILKVISTF